MLKGFKYRIYPTAEQIVLINKHIGASRFVYNLALDTKISAYQSGVNLSGFDLINQLPSLKKGCEWLKEISAASLQQSIVNLDTAYKNFFSKTANFPRNKSKWRGSQSFRSTQKPSIGDNGKLSIEKFREGIKIRLHRELKGKIKNVVISRTPTGKFFASILCDTGEECLPKKKITDKTTVGIDLGLKDFLITSDGEVINNPRFLRKTESRLKYAQRRYSKFKGKKSKYKVARLHEKVANQRKDFLHKVSTKLIQDNHSICIEDLDVKEMMQNRQLSKSISDVGWGMFREMLEYKAEWYGKNLLVIGRYEPSSKMCSVCKSINHDLKLSDREWTCTGCSTTHDRDLNAAVNIKNIAVSGMDTENQGELPELLGALTLE